MMRRAPVANAALLLLAGAVGGGAAVYLVKERSGGLRAEGLALSSAEGGLAARQGEGTREDSALTASARFAAYRAAAQVTDVEPLRSSLARAARAPPTLRGNIEIDAALARLAELDAAHAAGAALSLGLESRFVADAFADWARADAGAALQALADIERGGTRRVAALRLLELLGGDVSAFERVAAALPQMERASLQIDWLARRAEDDPYGALRELLLVQDFGVQRQAARRLAAAWARLDGAHAMAQAELLPAELRPHYLGGAAAEWARVDASGFLAHLETAPDVEALMAGIRVLVAIDPEGALAAAQGMQAQSGTYLRMSAAEALAERDPLAAIARVRAMPIGPARENLLQSVASGYARRDPDAALAWAAGLDPPAPNVQQAVIRAVAERDLDRALDLIDDPELGLGRQHFASELLFMTGQHLDEAAEVADRLRARNDPASMNSLAALMSSWVNRDPDSAVEWLAAHGATLDATVMSRMARSLAMRDAAAAASYVDRLPPEVRAEWIAEVAGHYARYDSAGALDWINRFQGQSGYDAALQHVLTWVAQTDPRAAAGMLAGASSEVQSGAASSVAAMWARQEPETAARWALALRDSRARASAVASAAYEWAGRDAEQARRWTLALQRGDMRDQALAMLLTQAAQASDRLDERLLDAFSSDAARERTVARAIPAIAARDPHEAQGLLDRYVTDPSLRRQIESARVGAAVLR